MKKVVIIAAMAVFSFTSINAQDVNFGVKAGLNLSSLSGDFLEEYDSRTSFHVGAVAEIVISEKFSFQPELLYSSQGAHAEESGYESTVQLDYLNLPLMAKFYVAEGLSLEAGPQIGLSLAANLKAEDEGDSYTEDIKDDVKGTDFGVNFGAGYKLSNGLNFGARYNLGLSDISDFEEGSGGDEIKNGIFQFSIGYFF